MLDNVLQDEEYDKGTMTACRIICEQHPPYLLNNALFFRASTQICPNSKLAHLNNCQIGKGFFRFRCQHINIIAFPKV